MGFTTTDGLMMSHPANGIKSTGIGAGIAALHVYTGTVIGTIAILDALRAAVDIGITEIILDAGTGAGSVAHATNGIRTTWRWIAWIGGWI